MQHKLILRLVILFVSISVTTLTNAQLRGLVKGWNLEGNDSGATIDPNATFGNVSAPTSISLSVSTVWTWNKNAGKWNFFTPSMTPSELSTYAASNGYGVLTAIPKGQGFWVNAKSAVSYNQSVPTMSFAPENSVSIFWIDQINPSSSVGSQKWGQVFTVPTSVETILTKASFYVNYSQSATYFKVQLSQWSDVLSQPVGEPLYTSAQVLFSTPNTNAPDSGRYVSPTFFTVNASVIPGQKYIFEILGDGDVGMGTTSLSDGSSGLFLKQEGSAWKKFVNIALRSDMWFTR